MQISIENLTLIYPSGKKALQNVTLPLESPNLIGLLGPNGAGKSTLMKLLVLELLPTSGEIRVDGKSLMKTEKELKSTLGYLPQLFGLYDELSVFQFLDYISALKGLDNSSELIDRVIDETHLEEKRNAPIRTLSGGQRQRVGIAQALLGNPSLLIFDEPTVGLDPEERIKIRNLFSCKAEERLILLSTHIIEDVQSVCNLLIVINHGRILFTGTPEGLILQARGHVGTSKELCNIDRAKMYHVTSRVNTAEGVIFRIVAEHLPDFIQPAEPTLEDAYIYLITRECED